MSLTDGMRESNLAIAHSHIYNVCESGNTIVLIKGTKDEFGEIISEETLELKSFPVRTTPYDKEVVDRITWAENTDILCYVSKYNIYSVKSLTIDDLKIYEKVKWNNITYDIRYVEQLSTFGSDFLYIIIGAKK